MLQKAHVIFVNGISTPLLIVLVQACAATTNLGVVVWGAPLYGGAQRQVVELDSNVQAVYSNWGSFAALKTNGEVVTWGEPVSGGDSSRVASQLSGNVTNIFSTKESFAALKASGKVVPWGHHQFGADAFPVEAQLHSNVINIFSNPKAFAALKAGGEVVTWGDPINGGDSFAVAVDLRRHVITVVGSGYFQGNCAFAALKTGGEVVTWGHELAGGDSSAVQRQLRRDVDVIFSNAFSFAALKTGGEVVTWGNHNCGGSSQYVAQQLRGDVTTIYKNDASFAALKSGGEVVTWGLSFVGGDSQTVASQLRSNVTRIFSNPVAFAALKAGGEVVTWGLDGNGGNSSAVASQLRNDVTTITGNGEISYLEDGWADCNALDGGWGAFAALKTSGEVVTWGDSDVGGNSSSVASDLGYDVITLFKNDASFAALKRNGKIVTWGEPFSGGFSQNMGRQLKSRVQSVVSSYGAYAALVCIPSGRLVSASTCMPCESSEFWKDMQCNSCEAAWEVTNAEQTECKECDVGLVPIFPDRNGCTGCPVFQKPSGSTLNTTCETDISMVLGASASVLLVILLCCPICLYTIRRRRRRLIQQAITKMRNRHKIHKSFRSIYTLDFPMVLLKAETFLGMRGLTPHETARRENVLEFLDTISNIKKFLIRHQIIFFSHQWLSHCEPDPDNIHYTCMVQALHSIADRRGWRLSNMYVWVDYTSIPQVCTSTQKCAISSLPIYASWSSAFVIISPNALHRDVGCECNLHTYSKRTWCRVECLSHYCHRSLEDMLVSNSAGLEQVTKDWLQDVLLIFEGDCSCCRLKHKDMSVCDKELLVLPVLAMYIHLLLEKHQSISAGQVYDVVQTLKDRMFPKSLTAEFTLDLEALSKRPREVPSVLGIPMMGEISTDTFYLDECVVEERELFGSLLEDLNTELPILQRTYEGLQNRQSFRESFIERSEQIEQAIESIVRGSKALPNVREITYEACPSLRASSIEGSDRLESGFGRVVLGTNNLPDIREE